MAQSAEALLVLDTDPRIGAACARGRHLLAVAGCDTPRLDAELLLAESLGAPRERIILDRDDVLGPAARERFEGLLARRIAREPVAYLLGRREFRRVTLSVDRRVLIPRPETELLVEVALEIPRGARVLDVGTGSGAVALALKDERPDLAVAGIDIDPGALAVARANQARLGLEVELACADLLCAIGADLLHAIGAGVAADGGYDAILANLPYVPDGTVLAPEIAGFEPPGALFGGPAGLDAVRRLITAVGDGARPLPLLALEIGSSEQARATMGMMRRVGFAEAEVRRDLAGRDRVVIGRDRVVTGRA